MQMQNLHEVAIYTAARFIEQQAEEYEHGIEDIIKLKWYSNNNGVFNLKTVVEDQSDQYFVKLLLNNEKNSFMISVDEILNYFPTLQENKFIKFKQNLKQESLEAIKGLIELQNEQAELYMDIQKSIILHDRGHNIHFTVEDRGYTYTVYIFDYIYEFTIQDIILQYPELFETEKT